MYISDIFKTKPEDNRSDLENKVYEELERLNIEYERVDNDSVESMEECIEISNKLGAEIRKTVFVCNRQKTNYYLVILPADKRFDSKKFSSELEIARVSFASGEDMEALLGVSPGTATIMTVLNDKDNKVAVIIDKEVANNEYFACNPGANTTHIKFKTSDLINKLLPDTNHLPKIIEL